MKSQFKGILVPDSVVSQILKYSKKDENVAKLLESCNNAKARVEKHEILLEILALILKHHCAYRDFYKLMLTGS